MKLISDEIKFVLSSEESETEAGNSENDKKHKKLLNDLDENLGHSKKRQFSSSRTEPSGEISEYNWSATSDKITLGDLVGSLDSTCQSVVKIRKKLCKMENKTKVLYKPLEKVERERIERTVAYEETSKDISKWNAIIQKNREAEQLIFPLGSYRPPPLSTKNMAIEFKPQNDMEKEISDVLHGSKHLLERKDKELTEAEEKALQTVDLEEALERRKELQKTRALQSYYEIKCRRAKKIKSKKYHRMLKKEQQKALSKIDIETLSKENPKLFHSEMEKAEKLRAKERANLRHRNSSKWAKNLITKGHKTKEEQEKVRNQLRISRQLTEHKTVDESEDEDKEIEKDNEATTHYSLLERKDDEENPWLLGGSNSKQSSTLTDSSKNYKKVEPIVTSESMALTEDKNNEVDIISSEDDCDSAEKVSTSKEIVPLSKVGKKKKKLKASILKNNNKNGLNSENECIEKYDNSDAAEVMQVHSDLKMPTSHTKLLNLLRSKSSEMKNATENKINPDLSKNYKSSNSLKLLKLDNVPEFGNAVGSSDDEAVIFDTSEQAVNIREAFANDDVIGDFIQEKNNIIEKSKPKQVDLTLPGWGDWAGPGLTVSKKKRKHFTKASSSSKKRKDDNIANLIINENSNNQFTQHQVAEVPFPYTNKAEFERSIRQPIGEHWNTPSVHNKLINPRIRVTPGTAIHPLKANRQTKKKFREIACK